MKYGVLLFLLLQAVSLGPALRVSERWVVWNVGQGLWITGIFHRSCLHLDAGGERKPPPHLRRWCEGKKNRLFLSHWDWDHVGGVTALRTSLPSLCREGLPGGSVRSAARGKSIERVPACPPGPSPLREIHWNKSGRSSNQMSRVWLWRDQWLFPGDSPRTEETRWARKLPSPKTIRILVLGHHGSRTSTSATLLDTLPGLRLAIASARRKVYGHPHPKVVERLAQRKIPLLRTEEWGHLIFEI